MDNHSEFIDRLYQRVGLSGLTERQRLFQAVEEVLSSDWVEYFRTGLQDGLSNQEREEMLEEFCNRCDCVLAGLKAIGVPNAARYFNRAMDGGDWDELHEGFLNAEPVAELLERFARKHPEDFGGDSLSSLPGIAPARLRWYPQEQASVSRSAEAPPDAQPPRCPFRLPLHRLVWPGHG